jgi:aspartyl-tRNA(Asn)/glutamyl-tRNA(Gln) amidotransferase subunit A
MDLAGGLAGRTFIEIAQAMTRGATTSRAVVDSALGAITDDPRAFCTVYAETARAAADACDDLRRSGVVLPPFAGVPVSIKDLFDVAGEPTPAGSVILRTAPPAPADAPVVARLRAAGLILIGRTQMSEFAFTGLGLNPHQPQPPNPRDPTRVPGGSSGGAAVSVALGQACGALGTDTGGSVRIPAAFCGLTALKPTQRRVTREGVFPLSPTQDSIGPIANSVRCCAILDAIIADAPRPDWPRVSLHGLRLGVPSNYLVDGLEPPVATAFEATLSALSRAGAALQTFRFAELDGLSAMNARGSISNAEAYALHRRLGLLEQGALYDPMVLSRVKAGAPMGAADYIDLLNARGAMISAADARTAGFDAVICPTTPIVPPRIADVADPERFARLNLMALRNTSAVNLLDRCAVSLPIGDPAKGCGLAIVGETGGDARLLAIAEAVEAILRPLAGDMPQVA